MAEITAEIVKTLRETTGVSMMECKKALVEAGGDMTTATRILREKGIAVAAKKATRATNQGLIGSVVNADASAGSLIEVNCETDFVAKNDNFKAFVNGLAGKACETDSPVADMAKAEVAAKIAQIGENIVVRRNTRLTVAGKGRIASYIHLGGKVGVLVDVGCEKDTTVSSPVFVELAKDITLQVAAANPTYLTSADVPADVIKGEREIYAKQVTGKPANVIDKIVDGKLKKFFSDVCLVDQLFVKEQKMTVTQLVEQKSKELGDKICIRKFVRYQMGA